MTLDERTDTHRFARMTEGPHDDHYNQGAPAAASVASYLIVVGSPGWSVDLMERDNPIDV